MMKMLIKIDEQKVIEDMKYDLTAMWNVIDKLFEKGCTKETQKDGSVLYSGDTSKDYFTSIGIAYVTLKEEQWFGEYCLEWILYDNDDDESLPFQDINLLKKEQVNNPLFVRV